MLPVLDVDRGVVERRVRAGGRVDDRPRALLLYLRVVPVGTLAAGVLEHNDFARLLPQRLLRGVGLEGELHPLPVALVEIVELVEVPEEPELQNEARVAGLAGDVGVSDRRRPTLLHQPREVLGVDAGLAQRVTTEVEVVVVAQTRDVARGGRLPHILQPLAGNVPGEGDVRVAEHRADAGRRPILLLSGIAGRVLLLSRHDYRCVGLSQALGRGLRLCRRSTGRGKEGRRYHREPQ